MFEIEKGVPIPSLGSGATAALRKMEVGDSVLFPVGTTNKNRLSSLFSKLAQTKGGAGKRFSQRKMPDGFRVWRIA